MFDVFGEMNTALKFFIAFAIVLALIALTAWLVRRFGANRIGGATRGRQPRLAVIDAASVDARRRLVLIRRDNIEHLLMIGGPTDVVVEQNIVRAASGRDLGRGPAAAPADTLPRAIPLADAGAWPLQPETNGNQAGMQPPMQSPAQSPMQSPAFGTMQMPMQPVSPRPSYRAAVTDEPWVPPEPARPRAEPPAPVAAPEVASRPALDFTPPRSAPPVATPPREPAGDAAPPLPPQNDRNLAEMAQRLEAALRQPGAAEPHPPVSDPLAAAASRELGAPMPPPMAQTMAQTMAPRPAPPRAESKPSAPAQGAFDSLEQEMANLLGRPSGKT